MESSMSDGNSTALAGGGRVGDRGASRRVKGRYEGQSDHDSDTKSESEASSDSHDEGNPKTPPEMITETQLFYLIDKNGKAVINSQGNAIWSMKTINHGKKGWTSWNEVDLAIQEMIKASRNENYSEIDANHKKPHYFLPHSKHTIHLVSEEHENPEKKKVEKDISIKTRGGRRSKRKNNKKNMRKGSRKKKGRKTIRHSKKSKS